MVRRQTTYLWSEVCAFWGMVIAGFTHFFGYFFNALVKWAFNDKSIGNTLIRVANILTLLGNIALLIAIAIPAYQFVKFKSKGWRTFYWIGLVLFILSVVFGVAIQF